MNIILCAKVPFLRAGYIHIIIIIIIMMQCLARKSSILMITCILVLLKHMLQQQLHLAAWNLVASVVHCLSSQYYS